MKYTLTAALFLAAIAVMQMDNEQTIEDYAHRDFCMRVAVYHNSLAYGGPVIGQRDVHGRCSKSDIRLARERLLSINKGPAY